MRRFGILLVFCIALAGCSNSTNTIGQASQVFEITAVNGEGKQITNQVRGERGKLAITDVPFSVGQNQKCMWFFWGDAHDLVGKTAKIVAVNEAGEQITMPLEQQTLGGENWGAPAHLLTFFSLPSKGLWRLDAYVDNKFFGNVNIQVQ